MKASALALTFRLDPEGGVRSCSEVEGAGPFVQYIGSSFHPRLWFSKLRRSDTNLLRFISVKRLVNDD